MGRFGAEEVEVEEFEPPAASFEGAADGGGFAVKDANRSSSISS
jgi:hypothetical protein